MLSGAHHRTSRASLVLLQLLVFVTYVFGPAAAFAVDPTPEPTLTESASPEPSTEPASEPAAVPTPEPTAEPTAVPTREPSAEPTATPAPTNAPTAPPAPSVEPVAAPTISSDKDDYAPGELVTLTGTNWVPGETVHIRVNDDQGREAGRMARRSASECG